MIVRVFPGDLAHFWPQMAPLLRAAVERAPTHSLEDVRLKLLSGAAQPWIQWAEPVVEAVIVTEFAVYPRGSWVRIWLDGALATVRQRHAAFLAELDGWRVAHGCVGFECAGRPGWARLFPEAKIEGVIMRWTVGGGA